MKIAVIIATRGRPELLQKSVNRLVELSKRDSTSIVCVIDDDDAENYVNVQLPFKATFVNTPRPDSLGEKYNVGARSIDADVYVLWADDVISNTEGWDDRIAEAAAKFSDGIGIVYFGKIDGVLQPGIAVTKKMVEAMGFFCVPYFPYWWHDTWIDEIGRMSDRIIYADVQMELLQQLAGKSRGVREIEFWAKFFDDTRFARRRVSQAIIDAGDDQPFRKQQLRSRLSSVETWVNQRNSILRNPADAKRLESHFGFDAPADERYERMKAASVETMNKLKAEAF